MSVAARKAVGERMKKYWAEKRRAAGAPASGSAAETESVIAAASQPTMSAEARARISAAQKKRWAARRRAGKKR
jgi:hypothetical protein